MSQLTQERLRELVSYDPETGLFTRIEKTRGSKLGVVIARAAKNGYVRLRIDYVLYYQHRLAWLYIHGEWPPAQIDHVDGDKVNNRISNLRFATCAENLQNRTLKSVNASGLRGVYYNEQVGKWQAKITSNYRQISLGYFTSPELAHQAYLAGKRDHHTFNPEFVR